MWKYSPARPGRRRRARWARRARARAPRGAAPPPAARRRPPTRPRSAARSGSTATSARAPCAPTHTHYTHPHPPSLRGHHLQGAKLYWIFNNGVLTNEQNTKNLIKFKVKLLQPKTATNIAIFYYTVIVLSMQCIPVVLRSKFVEPSVHRCDSICILKGSFQVIDDLLCGVQIIQILQVQLPLEYLNERNKNLVSMKLASSLNMVSNVLFS